MNPAVKPWLVRKIIFGAIRTLLRGFGLPAAFGSRWGALMLMMLVAGVGSAQNRVLELDGNGSYVELPPNLFTNLNQATVEVWAKWDSFRNYSRVLEFGAGWHSMSLFNHATTADLRFNLYPRRAQQNPEWMFSVRTNGVLRLNEWIHLAAVSGPGGMQLYANGVLVGRHTNAASLADIKAVHTNLFGRGLARNPTDQDFRGQIDEVRVWNHRRTQEQIRQNMRKRLTGTEDGLAGLWNFEDGAANDASGRGNRGKLVGNARVVTADSLADAALTADEVIATPPVATAASTSAPVAVTDDPRNAAAWLIAAALTLIAVLLVWLVLMLRRSGVGSTKLVSPGASPALLTDGGAGGTDASSQQQLKERALADLTEFAKQSLVQGLYSQRKALLEAQQKAQQELSALESRLVALHLPDRIQAYEKRIAELEKELQTRSGEVRELTNATLLLLRQKLEEERQLERKSPRF